uniref:Sorting nexin-1 n=1 Tax=Oryzias sinensis TaxID=183150 RepID=A0A8C7Z975_9TELE
MASSSERSPPPFPDTEDQDVLDSEEVGGRDSDEDDGEELFMSASNTPLTKQDTPTSPDSQASDLMEDLSVGPPSSQTEKSAASSSPEEFVDLTNNLESRVAAESSSPEPSDEFFDILGSETQKVEVEASVKADSGAPQSKASSRPEKGLFGEPDEDLFGGPLGAMSKKTTENEGKSGTAKAAGPTFSKPTEPADIFTEEAAATTVPRTSNTVNSKANGVHSEEDLFTEATVELSLDSPRSSRKNEETSKPSASSSSSSLSAPARQAKPPPAALEELEDEEEAELEDKFDVLVSVKDPEKVGDGMNAYMAYKVSTETTLPMFRNKLFTVRRRFSDFLGLYEKLSEKHGPNGLIVPPPPEKSILGMTKVKVGKEDSSSADFVERRRGALERYLQRVVNHPLLLQDPDVREFLEKDELPRAVSTQTLSGAGFLKMINKATDAVSKMTIKMNESDAWFEEKLQEVESADQHFRKLHALVESLVVHRKELSLNTANFAKSAAMLGSAEDNTALSRALSQLAEVEDKIEQLHQDQAAYDTFSFAELIADYIRLLGAVRGSFDHRIKAWQRWQDAQAMLQKKRETEAKLLWANKPDKLQQAKDEIVEWEARVTQFERDFERVSATVRKEVLRFEKQRTKNFKRQITKYLELLLQSQQQLIKYWEAFLPEAKAIA